MIYANGQEWLNARQKNVLLFGMSGLGKTYVANILRDQSSWFHYSVDYRIGTRYMGEHIVDNFKREAMKMPFLANLLQTDSLYIASNITFDNLSPLSTYLGKLGDPDKGGLSMADYTLRQEQHRVAEVASLLDTVPFIERAKSLYGYDNFVCDSGGSICEVVDPNDLTDPVLTALSQNLLLVWIKGNDDHAAELVSRFKKAPKPMYYRPHVLREAWAEFLALNAIDAAAVDPDTFAVFAYERAITGRSPLYRAMAENWGVTVTADTMATVKTAGDFNHVIAQALDAHGSSPTSVEV
jgi:hypothetical protein